jgi:hypothetical protein
MIATWAVEVVEFTLTVVIAVSKAWRGHGTLPLAEVTASCLKMPAQLGPDQGSWKRRGGDVSQFRTSAKAVDHEQILILLVVVCLLFTP